VPEWPNGLDSKSSVRVIVPWVRIPPSPPILFYHSLPSTTPSMPRRTERLQRRITAYHEAAHAVLAFRFGIPVDEIAICSTGRLAGYVKLSDGPLMFAVEASRCECTSELEWALLVRDTEQRAMVSLAGAIAEAKLLGTPLRSHCCESDLRKCLQLCYALCGYREHLVETTAMSLRKIDPAEMADRLRGRTQRILGHPNTWRAVTTLARDLEGWGVLTGHDSAETVQWSGRIRNQLTLLLPMPRSTTPKPPMREKRSAIQRFAATVMA
jgi:hypothetical protein